MPELPNQRQEQPNFAKVITGGILRPVLVFLSVVAAVVAAVVVAKTTERWRCATFWRFLAAVLLALEPKLVS